MLEMGLFPRGKDFGETKAFKLDSWKKGFDVAAKHSGIGKCVCSLCPLIPTTRECV